MAGRAGGAGTRTRPREPGEFSRRSGGYRGPSRTGGSGRTGRDRPPADRDARTSRTSSSARTYGRPRPEGGRRGDVAFRRTLVVTLLSVVVPGAGHLALRHRTVGRIALRTYLVLLVVGVVLALAVPHDWWLSLAFKPGWLRVVQVGAVVLAVLWAGIVAHAFVLSRPQAIRRPRTRGVAGLIALALLAVIVVPFGVTARYAGVQRDLVASMFPAGGTGPTDRMNILLIGGDSGADRTGTRTDTMMVASVDVATGRTVLLSLPRNLQHVPMAGKAAKRFPHGFDDLLNAVYQYGDDHPGLEPGSKAPGADLLKQTVGGVLGLPVHYYLMVDLKGFQQMIDALGGVTIRVNEKLPIGGDGGVPITGYVQPGLQHLDGYHALWYARSRLLSSDYDRMVRQRCLVGALQHQADPANVLARYQSLAAASKHLFRTDIPQNVMSTLVGVADKAKDQKLRSLAFVPPLVDTSDPDWQLIRDRSRAAIRASMKPPAKKASSRPPALSTAPPKKDVAVDDVCRYS